MSEKHELPSDSDEDDEDYLPEGQSSASEEESDVDKESEVDEDGVKKHKNSDAKVQKRCKRRKNKATKRMKNQEIPLSSDELVENDSKINVLNDEEQKKRADSLWADFLKDSPVISKSKSKNTTENSISGKSDNHLIKSKNDKVKITKIYEFAGEKFSVEKEALANSTEAKLLVSKTENTRDVNVSSAIEKSHSKELGVRKIGVGGIASVLGRLGKKAKVSTLEKSKMDWDNFKKQENIEEEINSHNRGKDGYLEKQDFLQRADFRQFEIEKQLRNTSRRSNR